MLDRTSKAGSGLDGGDNGDGRRQQHQVLTTDCGRQTRGPGDHATVSNAVSVVVSVGCDHVGRDLKRKAPDLGLVWTATKIGGMADRLGVLLALPLFPCPPLRLPFSFRTFSSSCPALAKTKKRMPPKKAAAPEKKTLLGRPSNNLKIGIVGLFRSRSSRHLIHGHISQGCRMLGSPRSSMS